MRNTLNRSLKYNLLLDMIYMTREGQISRRRVTVLQLGETTFRAYCHMRGARRTFAIDNILALVPVNTREKVVI